MRLIEHGPEPGPDAMRVVQGPVPVPAAGEILIEVHFAGVNGPDLMQRQGRYPPPPGASPVLGLEVSGRVTGLGAGVTQWRVGDMVAALVPGGGYAEYCVAPQEQALPVPAGLSLAQAAGLPENWFTVWANLVDRARLIGGERLLIHGGSSGIGLAAIGLARLRGAIPYVTVGSPEKAAFCVQFGAEAAIEYRSEDFVEAIRRLTGKDGVDVVLDMVGGPYLQKNVSVLKRDGRLVMIAFQQGSRVEFDFMPVMIKRLFITGSTMRPRTVAEKAAIRDALAREVWPAIERGDVRTHLFQTFALDQAAQAHRLMESSRHIGKVVLQLR